MNAEQKKILIVEDDYNFGNILKDYLMLNDYFVVLAKNGIEGMEKFKKENFFSIYFRAILCAHVRTTNFRSSENLNCKDLRIRYEKVSR